MKTESYWFRQLTNHGFIFTSINDLSTTRLKKTQLFLPPFKLIKRFRTSTPDVFFGKGVLEICSKFTRKHPCRNVISIVAKQLS